MAAPPSSAGEAAAAAAAVTAAAPILPSPSSSASSSLTHLAYLHAWPLIGRLGTGDWFPIKKLDFDSVRQARKQRVQASELSRVS